MCWPGRCRTRWDSSGEDLRKREYVGAIWKMK
jgi:hypothetical protein